MSTQKNEKEKAKSKHSESNPAKAGFSLVGLLFVAAVVYYGMPYLTNALKSVIGSESVDETVEGELVVGSDDIIKQSSEVETPETFTADVVPDKEVDIVALQNSVRNALEGALKTSAKQAGDFFLEQARYSKKANSVKAIFQLEGEKRELLFIYDENFEEHKATISDAMKQLFSISPTFILPFK